MIYLRTVLFALVITLAAWPMLRAQSAPQGNTSGLWLTENHRAVIKIAACAGKPDHLCGSVFWIIQGGMKTDYKNPDPAQRSRPTCGMPVMWNFRPLDETHWNDGTIYKADDGDIYHAVMQLLSANRLLVHGYIGMPLFGVSQTWTRVSEADYPECVH